jgi:hypothetical protein
MREDDPELRDAGVLSGLPRARPQRRSERRDAAPRRAAPAARPKRAAKPRPKARPKPEAAPRPGRIRQPAQPSGTPPRPSAEAEKRRTPQGPEGIVVAAAQAAEEVARLGVAVSGQVVKGVLRRIPRP